MTQEIPLFGNTDELWNELLNTSNHQLNIQNEFLNPVESNFDILLFKIAILHQKLQKKMYPRRGRRTINPYFSYAELSSNIEIPFDIQDFEQTVEKTLEAFEGCIRWHDPNALFNITPSPLLDTVALATITSLYNPNALWDITSGKFVLFEQRVVKLLGRLANWNPKDCGGLFTFGGKATLMYAIKLGINRCDRESVSKGLKGRYVVICGGTCHFSIESICNYIGIGQDNCVRLQLSANAKISLFELEKKIRQEVECGAKIACIILSGGGTMNLSIDPIKEVSNLINRLVNEYALPYIPYLHVDTVISWAWLFFKELTEIDITKLVTDAKIRQNIETTMHAIAEVEYADSFAADFHKTGMSPYISSCIICKSESEIRNLNSPNNNMSSVEYFGEGNNFNVTLENSRSCIGIVTAYHVLQRFGTIGIASYITFFINVREWFCQAILEKYSHRFEVINTESLGFEIVFKVHFFQDTRSYVDICCANQEDKKFYHSICYQFSQFLNRDNFANHNDTPFIGYIANYKCDVTDKELPAFLIYPVSMYFTRTIVYELLEKVAKAVNEFEQLYYNDKLVKFQNINKNIEPPK